VVNNRVKRIGSGSDNKIKDMMLAISWKGNMLSEIGRIKSSYELLDLRVIG